MTGDLWVGLDVGSTTVKVAVWDPIEKALIHSRYERHFADQVGAARRLLTEVHDLFPQRSVGLAACGSGGQPVTEALGGLYIQEVVAASIAIQNLYPRTKTAVELGGQDAKVLFFKRLSPGHGPQVTDMRMNGVCAGGTGAFLDQMAELLSVKGDGFAELARLGERVYDVSGRCGVFAKTDVQPLLNSGVAPADIALSCLHALVRQVIGGLAQGMELEGPLLLLGGPFHYQRRLVSVFAERLSLGRGEIILPENPERVVALGAAMSLGESLGAPIPYRGRGALNSWVAPQKQVGTLVAQTSAPRVFFKTKDEALAYREKRKLPDLPLPPLVPGGEMPLYLGVDAGSTTLKIMATDEGGQPIWRFYRPNGGRPLEVMKEALLELKQVFAAHRCQPRVLGLATTGYGEHLMAKALGADTHTVETVAHAEAAARVCPGVSFVLDIGGQDMKAIWLHKGVITRMVLNEACSAGCGSFLETFAQNLGVAVGQIAESAFNARSPSRLGSRCTVFMNSSVTTEQRNGMGPDDILAGLCQSVVENLFTKVVRISHPGVLGPEVVVQGGTFKNDAVLKAFEDRLGKEVTRSPYPGEMGAWGAALLARKHHLESRPPTGSSFIGFDHLEELSWQTRSGDICPFCANHCNRSVVVFDNGKSHVTGNRCEKGEVFGDPGSPVTRQNLETTQSAINAVPDTARLQQKLFFQKPLAKPLLPPNGVTIGIPGVLEFWNSYPFWNTVFHCLGFAVKRSPPSSFSILEKGLPHVPSDTVCLPAKLSHGHIEALLGAKVDRIFMPKVFTLPAEDRERSGIHLCAVIEGTPLVIQETQNPQGRHQVPFDSPSFYWHDDILKIKQITQYFEDNFGLPPAVVARAIALGDQAMADYHRQMAQAGADALAWAEKTGGFAVLLAGRPYHSDPFIQHDLSKHFTRLAVPVLVPDAFPLKGADLSRIRAEVLNPFHGRLYSAALRGAEHPRLEVVQLVSFGCGHDAVTSDEMERVLLEVGQKNLLVLKLDEGDARGPLRIRIQSFVETVRQRRARGGELATWKPGNLPLPFPAAYHRRHRKNTTVLVPNLAPAMGPLLAAVLRREGYRAHLMATADGRAIELGKKFVHNDACYPALLNIGEALRAFETKAADPMSSALAVAKTCKECRAGQYAALARKALDDAGYPQVPVVTSGEDTKKGHPGYAMGTRFRSRMIWGVAMADGLHDLLLATRPYEVHPGSAEALFRRQTARIAAALEKGTRPGLSAFRRAVGAFRLLKTDRKKKRSPVFITGEILVNFHPGANRNLVTYLEGQGMEVHLPHLISFFRVDSMRARDGADRFFTVSPRRTRLVASIEERLFKRVLSVTGKIMAGISFLEKGPDLLEARRHIDPFIDPTMTAGEGWLIPGEILGWAQRGVANFVIVQPFGCMPNHITGRGLVKSLKKRLPEAQILCLDYDPDSSAANIENRLLMMVLADRQKNREKPGAHAIISGGGSHHAPNSPDSTENPLPLPGVGGALLGGGALG